MNSRPEQHLFHPERFPSTTTQRQCTSQSVGVVQRPIYIEAASIKENIAMQEVLDKVPSVDEVIREVSRLSTTVTQAVEEGFKSAVKAVEQGRQTTEDMIADGKLMMRRKPVESAGVIFAAGMLTGAFLTWLVSNRD
jgi:hypothetical protein